MYYKLATIFRPAGRVVFQDCSTIHSRPWGEWILSSGTLNIFHNENNECGSICDKKYLSLIEENNSKVTRDYNSFQYLDSVMNDFLPFDPFVSKKANLSTVCTNKEMIVSNYVLQLISSIRNGTGTVQEMTELVSNTSDEVLSNILLVVWQTLTSGDEKTKFIKLISVCTSSSHLFCKDVLLIELKDEPQFHNIMDIINPVSNWLESHLILNTLIPLLLHASSLLIKDPNNLKRTIESLSSSQKYDLLSGYIDEIEGKLQRHHLEVLVVLLENITLSSKSLPKLINLFLVSILDYNEDRMFGKMLLLISDGIAMDTYQNILTDFSLVCNKYKGALRFRIKSSLKKKIHV